MSGPKTGTRQQKKTKDTGAEQQCSPPSVCCDHIRERAYYKWEAAGCPCGDDVEFWLQAEAELAVKTQEGSEVSKT